jgi:hypothetical protein
VGAAIANGIPMAIITDPAAAAAISPGLRKVEEFITFHQTTALRHSAS